MHKLIHFPYSHPLYSVLCVASHFGPSCKAVHEIIFHAGRFIFFSAV